MLYSYMVFLRTKISKQQTFKNITSKMMVLFLKGGVRGYSLVV